MQTLNWVPEDFPVGSTIQVRVVRPGEILHLGEDQEYYGSRRIILDNSQCPVSGCCVKSQKLKPGDVVRLKSGSHIMTVDLIDEDKLISTVWYDYENKEFKREFEFLEHQLEKING